MAFVGKNLCFRTYFPIMFVVMRFIISMFCIESTHFFGRNQELSWLQVVRISSC